MAQVDFAVVTSQSDSTILRAGPLGAGDVTNVLTTNEGNWDVGVHVYGTIGGSTVVVTGGFASAVGDFAVVDDAFGVPLSFTTLPQVKPIGPPLRQARVSVIGGVGFGIFVDVHVTRKRG